MSFGGFSREAGPAAPPRGPTLFGSAAPGPSPPVTASSGLPGTAWQPVSAPLQPAQGGLTWRRTDDGASSSAASALRSAAAPASPPTQRTSVAQRLRSSGVVPSVPTGQRPVGARVQLFQMNSPDPSLSKRTRSTQHYQDVDSPATVRDDDGRRIVTYTDNLYGNGKGETAKRMRAPSADLNFIRNSSSSDVQSVSASYTDRFTQGRTQLGSGGNILSPLTYDDTDSSLGLVNSVLRQSPQSQRISPLRVNRVTDQHSSKLSSPTSLNHSGGSNTVRTPHTRSLTNYADLSFQSDQLNQGPASNNDLQRLSPGHINERKSSLVGVTALPHQKFHTNSLPMSPPKPHLGDTSKRALSPQGRLDAAPRSPLIDSSEREAAAKQKRLARFHVELSQSTADHNDSLKKFKDIIPQEKVLGTEDRSMRLRGDIDAAADIEFMKSDNVIGLCQDMCPESEREERERKGDLDKYERLDRERNQTTKFLAVKKYNRMAERAAELIRPLQVLQKTMDYLLKLLDHPYDENFLYIYNFLWDRMRAIRMDLRMQHIIDQEAVTMLEQMIRLHIIAMHELCEYNKGEGVAEGFDAHLNIEQMNKTSVELFQMYDDHRRMGIIFPSEEEFRGYYALLKLDKHPGYKVEPAELSLDLAKMSQEVRRSPEILFARDVARACRSGNFVAFFRLARKATYLQACLMHAHFSKLRRQALASLHSGLQSNRGIPVMCVIKWLGMEDDDIESLLLHHGFMLRSYEEPYIVKEGPFTNHDIDFPSTRSQLVDCKKSQRILSDVQCAPINDVGATIKITHIVPLKNVEAVPQSDAQITKGHLTRNKAEGSDGDMLPPVFQLSTADSPKENIEDLMVEEHRSYLDVSDVASAKLGVDRKLGDSGVPEFPIDASIEPRILLLSGVVSEQIEVPLSTSPPYFHDNETHSVSVAMSLDTVDAVVVPPEKSELPPEKLIKILRKWRDRATDKRLYRQQKEDLAIAALSSLSLGPPIQSIVSAGSHSLGQLNIMDAVAERRRKEAISFSRLNVSKLVGPLLIEKNPGSKCLCWKLLIFLLPGVSEQGRSDLTSQWLHKKLSGTAEDHEVSVSLPEMSIWTNWFPSLASHTELCCLSIIRFINDETFDDYILSGTSSIVFQVSAGLPWNIQRSRLSSLLATFPSGTKLPLLLICGDVYSEEQSTAEQSIIDNLGLPVSGENKISSFSVIFIGEHHLDNTVNSFFDDEKLGAGLQWLADHSPQQAAVSLVKTYDLYLSRLRPSLIILENNHSFEVGPNDVISAFNKAIDEVADTVFSSALSNCANWPCPEIEYLDLSSYEGLFAQMHLPSPGWSLVENVEPLVTAIRSCKLPSFPSDVSWLRTGTTMSQKIIEQKIDLQECLVTYLTELAQLFNRQQAAKEAEVIVRKGVRLELRGSSYYLVPKWVTIFRRIFNWRASKLVGKELSVAYISNKYQDQLYTMDPDTAMLSDSSEGCMDVVDVVSGFQSHELPSPAGTLPFDEIFDASCDIQPEELQVDEHVVLPSWVHRTSTSTNVGVIPGHPEGSNGELLDHIREQPAGSEQPARSSRTVNFSRDLLSILAEHELTQIIDRCGEVQDGIDRKLSIYF